MIQLNHHMDRELLILVGKALEQYQGFELGSFYAEKEDLGDVVLWLYLPGNGHLVGRHIRIHHWNTKGNQEAYFKAAQEWAHDLNTLLNLKTSKGLSNTA